MPLDEQLIALGNRGAKVAENSKSNLVDSDNEENNSAIKAGEFRESVKGKEANYNKEGSEYNQDEKTICQFYPPHLLVAAIVLDDFQ